MLSSFRNVGVGVLVNSRPITPPYVFDVVGNPDTLAANLLSSTSGGHAGTPSRTASASPSTSATPGA